MCKILYERREGKLIKNKRKTLPKQEKESIPFAITNSPGYLTCPISVKANRKEIRFARFMAFEGCDERSQGKNFQDKLKKSVVTVEFKSDFLVWREITGN